MRALGRALSRKTGPDRRTGQRPSKRWQRAATRLGRAHARVANLRRDGLHKLTTRLAREHATVVVEDLNVTGMLANRRLARHIADAGFAEIRRQLTYKTSGTAAGWSWPTVGIRPQDLLGCGAVKTKLALSEANLQVRGVRPGPRPGPQRRPQPGRPRGRGTTAGSGPVAGRGADQKTRTRGQVAVKRQPGTARGSDRDRPTARQDCCMSATEHSTATEDLHDPPALLEVIDVYGLNDVAEPTTVGLGEFVVGGFLAALSGVVSSVRSAAKLVDAVADASVRSSTVLVEDIRFGTSVSRDGTVALCCAAGPDSSWRPACSR